MFFNQILSKHDWQLLRLLTLVSLFPWFSRWSGDIHNLNSGIPPPSSEIIQGNSHPNVYCRSKSRSNFGLCNYLWGAISAMASQPLG